MSSDRVVTMSSRIPFVVFAIEVAAFAAVFAVAKVVDFLL